jgi:AcrR family transcriptional regulator
VAEAAGISRATAYRYFPTQEMLTAEVALFSTEGPLSPEIVGHGPLPERVGQLVRSVGQWAYDNEEPLRTILRLSLDPKSGVQRPGHRVEWIASALEPVRGQMDDETYARLASALTLLIGIDPVVVMKDIAGTSREEGLDTLEWCARTLVAAAMEGKRTAPGRRK